MALAAAKLAGFVGAQSAQRVGGIHVDVQLVGRLLQLGLKAERGAVGLASLGAVGWFTGHGELRSFGRERSLFHSSTPAPCLQSPPIVTQHT